MKFFKELFNLKNDCGGDDEVKLYEENIKEVKKIINNLKNSEEDKKEKFEEFNEEFSKSVEYLKEKVKKNCNKFVGKNIAITGKRILGISKNFSPLFSALKEKNVDTNYVFIIKVYNTENEWERDEEKIGAPIHGITLKEIQKEVKED